MTSQLDIRPLVKEVAKLAQEIRRLGRTVERLEHLLAADLFRAYLKQIQAEQRAEIPYDPHDSTLVPKVEP